MATESTEKKKPTTKKKTTATDTKKTTRKKTAEVAATETKQPTFPQKTELELHAERIAMLKQKVIPQPPKDTPTPPKFGGSKAVFPICVFSLFVMLAIVCLLSIVVTWPIMESIHHGDLSETAPEWAGPAMVFSVPVRIVLAIFLIIWAWDYPKKIRQRLKAAKNAKAAWGKAISGDANEQARLAFQYKKDPKTYALAVYLATAAASTGKCRGLFALGCLLIEGKALPKDEQRAMELFELAAESNHGGAIYNLGMHAMKNGNEALAYKYWKKAAELQNPYAAFNMAIYHYQKVKGIKVANCTKEQKEHNYEMFRYFRIAARQGLGAAERNLGCLYSTNFYIENANKLLSDFWNKRSDKTLTEKSSSVKYYGKPFTVYQLREWNIIDEKAAFYRIISRVKMDRKVFQTYYENAFRTYICGDYYLKHSFDLDRWKSTAEWQDYQYYCRREVADVTLKLFGSATIYVPDTEKNVKSYVDSALFSYTSYIRTIYLEALLQDPEINKCPTLLEYADNKFMIIKIDTSDFKIEQFERTKYTPAPSSSYGRSAPSYSSSGSSSGGSSGSAICNDYKYTDVDISYSTSGSYTDSIYGTENVNVSGSATFYYENSQGDRTSRTASFSFSCSAAYVDSEVEHYVSYNLGHYKTY